MAISTNDSSPRLTSLEVIGLGISIEDSQLLQIWEEIQDSPKSSFLSSDPESYPEIAEERRLATESRSTFVLSAAAKHFVQHWPIPSVSIWPGRDMTSVSADTPDLMASYFANRIDNLRNAAEMPSHQIASLGAFCSNEPEEVLERAFQFFDGYPDVPALLLFATDGDMTRKLVGDTNREANWKDGPRRFDSMAETMVALILARRERIDALRPFAGARETHTHAATSARSGFKPTKYLPEAWTAEQIDEFDRLKTIAIIHRPIQVDYLKEKDAPATADTEQKIRLIAPQLRLPVFKEAFDMALQAIPEGKPTRIFYDTGGGETGGNITPLFSAALASLPESDLNDPNEGVDISQRIGNTGACSPFVMWALAAMTSYENRASGITVNLRRREGAMITAITPSVKKQDIERIKPTIPTSLNDVRSLQPAMKALGTRQSSGDECTQSGMWQCSPADAKAGNLHFIPAGRIFPLVRVTRELGAWQKLRGEPHQVNVPATWTLVSYDKPTA